MEKMGRTSNYLLSLIAVLTFGLMVSSRAKANEIVWLEAESFAEQGGWVVDQQFMDLMGSPYLLAHGLGEPVLDAQTEVQFPHPGEYRVWVRTRDWVAPWNAPGAPGRFQLVMDGKPLKKTFGVEGAQWHWQDGGMVTVDKQASVALHDLTGFEGRCDAILFSSNPGFVPPDSGKPLTQLRGAHLGWSNAPAAGGHYDLVIVGGGVAGTSAAITAARLGVKVALIQDRPVLGGNGSSEVRVWPEGNTNLQPYPRVGDVVSELIKRKGPGDGNARDAQVYEDKRKLDLARAEPNLTLLLEHRVNAAKVSSGTVQSVVAQHIRSGQRVRVTGKWFLDSTGDAVVGHLVGADYEITETGHLGSSNLWNLGAVEKNEFQLKCLCEDDDPLSLNFTPSKEPAPFPKCPWAVDLRQRDFPGRGDWRSAAASDGLLDRHGAALGIATPGETTQAHSLAPIAFTWIRKDKQTLDENETNVFIGSVAPGGSLRGLLSFDISSVTPSDSLGEVKLRLVRRKPVARSNAGSLADASLALSQVTTEGVSNQATWLTTNGASEWRRPGGDTGPVLATATAAIDSKPTAETNVIEFATPELTSAVVQAIKQGKKSVTFLIASPEAEAASGRNFFVFGPSPGTRGPSLGSLGGWFWESGFDKDPIHDTEQIRDQNLRAMYGAWDTLKNTDGRFPNHRLKWAAFVAGKRESRRLMGDVVLTGDDFRNKTPFKDAAFPCTWDLDLHTPDPNYDADEDPFISVAHFGKYEGPYWAPYRSLYSRNIDNLFMAGRDISVTHEALGAVRVMRTCGMMGEVVGMAASICRKHKCSPREVYEKHLDELIDLLKQGAGRSTTQAAAR